MVLCRPWDATLDVELSDTMEGTRHYYYNMTCAGVYTPKGGLEFFGEFHRMMPTWVANTFLDDFDYATAVPFMDYVLPGSFITSQESNLSVINFIDNMGKHVTNTKYYNLDLTPYTSPVIPLTEGIAEYDTSRHNWS